jgi:hypothetical protein
VFFIVKLDDDSGLLVVGIFGVLPVMYPKQFGVVVLDWHKNDLPSSDFSRQMGNKIRQNVGRWAGINSQPYFSSLLSNGSRVNLSIFSKLLVVAIVKVTVSVMLEIRENQRHLPPWRDAETASQSEATQLRIEEVYSKLVNNSEGNFPNRCRKLREKERTSA